MTTKVLENIEQFGVKDIIRLWPNFLMSEGVDPVKKLIPSGKLSILFIDASDNSPMNLIPYTKWQCQGDS
jgi:hypothetical protein